MKIQVQGVSTSGVIDTGADITIMGGDLFNKVATAARLRKKDFKEPDRVPRTYIYVIALSRNQDLNIIQFFLFFHITI